MGANPMQKMKRNSILTGLIIGLFVGLILCGVEYFIIGRAPGSVAAGGNAVSVCVLNKTIKSGTPITQADVVMKNVSADTVPADRTTEVLGAIAKVDLTAGTVLSKSMLSNEETKLTADLRQLEYNMIALPSQLLKGDFVDIRLQLPSGGDYIVISKKQVENCNATTIWLKMNEEEILALSNAIVEYYIMPGSKLYATKYTDPGVQPASSPTYCPNAEVAKLILDNPNISVEIRDGQGRLTNKLKELRNSAINTELNRYSEDRLENLEKKIEEEIQSLRESRETYFGTLNSAN